MTKKEIEKLMNSKGTVGRTIFNTYFEVLIKHDNFEYLLKECDEDTIATICYNLTILMMNIILDNPVYFEKRCKVKERHRIRMHKDLEKMEFLNYPNGSTDRFIEEEIISNASLI